MLDIHGRDIDTMGGNPLPLRLEAVEIECSKYSDPEGLRWRLLLIDKMIMEARRKRADQKHGGK